MENAVTATHVTETSKFNSQEIFLNTALVWISDSNGIQRLTKILLDAGSERSYIVEDLKNSLELDHKGKEYLVVSTLEHKGKATSREKVEFLLKGTVTDHTTKVRMKHQK
ncbi:hypothetical protein O3M35_002180 [Rhynocoris fuscipes]|uniref:Peptidase aspartic putative domain-containing protein n=1 Tax=Rhynocoris fuscipes TaxID=488301 RepID=A0AAW1CQ86_9HEMI